MLVYLALGVLLLGPLAAVSAAYMNFKLGFFLGGSILAGILGSVVSIWYGPEGRHGANYIQTLASAMGSLGGMVTLLQSAAWLGLPIPHWWEVTVYLMCAGLFGIVVGNLTTPLLVDRWQLEFPSGRAVADLLRALTDPQLFRRSVRGLGTGAALGFSTALPFVSRALSVVPGLSHFSAAVPGAGLIVGARIGLPAVTLAAIGLALEPWLVATGRLASGSSFRSIGYLFALAMIVGGALVYMLPLLRSAIARSLNGRATTQTAGNSLWMWSAGGLTAVLCLFALLWQGIPVAAALAVLLLVPVFILANGISTGKSDLNPISSAFVLATAAASLAGAIDARALLFAGGAVLVACSVGVDMQQDRSTGARLGSDRSVQFSFQTVGTLVGAMLTPALGSFFFAAFPELLVFPPVSGWESAMSLKLAGTVRTVRAMSSAQVEALVTGFVVGILLAVLRRVCTREVEGRPVFSPRPALDFVVDAILLPSPFAFSFGGFVSFRAAAWFAGGSVLRSLWDLVASRKSATDSRPADEMNPASLLGGGLIAGETLAYVLIGFSLFAAQWL